MAKSATDLTPDELNALLRDHGTITGAAEHLGIPRTTLRHAYHRHGIASPAATPSPRQKKGLLTREHLETALTPPNKCAVRQLLDRMGGDEREVLEEALGYDPRDFKAQQIIDMLVKADYREQELPGTDAINDHRAGRRPCRCRG